ncbi:MAG: hydrolase [Planctomycetaceae bacterium]
MNSVYSRSVSLLSRTNARLLVIDMQEKLVPAIFEHTSVLNACHDLAKAAEILRVPILATEQYPKGLGPTVSPLCDYLSSPIEKLRFSAAEALGWNTDVGDEGTSQNQVVVIGIEAHVCVQQTVLDLISQGFTVFVPVDAIGSRFPIDRDVAIQRMRDFGATITTTESVIFELCETAAADEFKEISKLIRSRG